MIQRRFKGINCGLLAVLFLVVTSFSPDYLYSQQNFQGVQRRNLSGVRANRPRNVTAVPSAVSARVASQIGRICPADSPVMTGESPGSAVAPDEDGVRFEGSADSQIGASTAVAVQQMIAEECPHPDSPIYVGHTPPHTGDHRHGDEYCTHHGAPKKPTLSKFKKRGKKKDSGFPAKYRGFWKTTILPKQVADRVDPAMKIEVFDELDASVMAPCDMVTWFGDPEDIFGKKIGRAIKRARPREKRDQPMVSGILHRGGLKGLNACRMEACLAPVVGLLEGGDVDTTVGKKLKKGWGSKLSKKGKTLLRPVTPEPALNVKEIDKKIEDKIRVLELTAERDVIQPGQYACLGVPPTERGRQDNLLAYLGMGPIGDEGWTDTVQYFLEPGSDLFSFSSGWGDVRPMRPGSEFMTGGAGEHTSGGGGSEHTSGGGGSEEGHGIAGEAAEFAGHAGAHALAEVGWRVASGGAAAVTGAVVRGALVGGAQAVLAWEGINLLWEAARIEMPEERAREVEERYRNRNVPPVDSDGDGIPDDQDDESTPPTEDSDGDGIPDDQDDESTPPTETTEPPTETTDTTDTTETTDQGEGGTDCASIEECPNPQPFIPGPWRAGPGFVHTVTLPNWVLRIMRTLVGPGGAPRTPECYGDPDICVSGGGGSPETPPGMFGWSIPTLVDPLTPLVNPASPDDFSGGRSIPFADAVCRPPLVSIPGDWWTDYCMTIDCGLRSNWNQLSQQLSQNVSRRSQASGRSSGSRRQSPSQGPANAVPPTQLQNQQLQNQQLQNQNIDQNINRNIRLRQR